MTSPSGAPVSTKRLADAGWLTVLPLALNFISLAANGFIIRMLGESGYGTLMVAMGLSGATTLLSSLGLRALYTKAVAGADGPTTERLMAEQLGLRLGLGSLAALIAFAAALLLYPTDHAILACTALQALGVIAWVGWTVLADVLNARECFATNARVAFVAGLALTLTSATAAAAGGGPVAVAAAYLIGPVVNFLLLVAALRPIGLRVRVGGASWSRYRALLHDARALAANDLVSMMNSRAEGIWSPLLFGKALVGVNGAGMLPVSRLEMAADGVATAYFPAIAAAHSRAEHEVVRHQAHGMFSLLLTATIPLGIFTWFGAPYLAQILFPGDAQGAARDLCTFVAQTTALALPISATGVGMRYALQAVGLHSRNAKDQIRATLVGAGVTLAFALILGIRGLALAVLARAILVRLLQARLFREAYPRLFTELPWGRISIASCIPLAVLGAGIGFAGTASLLRAVFVAAVAAALCAAAVLSLRLVERPALITHPS